MSHGDLVSSITKMKHTYVGVVIYQYVRQTYIDIYRYIPVIGNRAVPTPTQCRAHEEVCQPGDLFEQGLVQKQSTYNSSPISRWLSQPSQYSLLFQAVCNRDRTGLVKETGASLKKEGGHTRSRP